MCSLPYLYTYMLSFACHFNLSRKIGDIYIYIAIIICSILLCSLNDLYVLPKLVCILTQEIVLMIDLWSSKHILIFSCNNLELKSTYFLNSLFISLSLLLLLLLFLAPVDWNGLLALFTYYLLW